jgi:ankyrin repeat protein
MGSTPLHFSVFYNHPKLTKLLVNSHASVNERDEEQSTPLHKAAFVGNKEALLMLINAGTVDHFMALGELITRPVNFFLSLQERK